MLKQSRYNIITPGTSGSWVTNLVTRAVMWVDEEGVDFFQKNPTLSRTEIEELNNSNRGTLGELISNGYYIPSDTDEIDTIIDLHRTARNDEELLQVTIALTLRCNMSCSYCFEKRRPDKISPKVREDLVAHIRKQHTQSRNIHVQWFGGEPLLEVKSIQELSPALRAIAIERGGSYSAELTTNGYLLSSDIARTLADLGVGEAQITLDGSKATHDKIRYAGRDKGSFDQIKNNIISASEYIDIVARVHIRPGSEQDIETLLFDLAESGVHAKISRIYFAPLFEHASFHQRDDKVGADLLLNSKTFAEIQLRLISLAKRLGFKVGSPLGGDYGICVAMRHASLVVNPDGSFGKCYLHSGDQSRATGRLGSTEVSAEATRWETYSFLDDPECRTCSFLPICMAGCPEQRMTGVAKEFVCTPLKFNFHGQIKAAYEEAKTETHPD